MKAISLLFILYVAQLAFLFPTFLFHGTFLISPYTLAFKLLTVYSVRCILDERLKPRKIGSVEYPIIMILALLFMLLLVGSSHLISGFLALVGFSLNLYVLILFDASRAVAREAGVKYFYLSTLSSGLMLYGIFMIFLVLGTGQFHEIGQLLSTNANLLGYASGLLSVGLSFLLVGLFFKLSAFPGHL